MNKNGSVDVGINQFYVAFHLFLNCDHMVLHVILLKMNQYQDVNLTAKYLEV